VVLFGMSAAFIVFDPSLGNILFPFILLAVLLYGGPLLAALLTPSSREEIGISLDDSGIVVVAKAVTTQFGWDYYTRVDEDRHAFYLVERRKLCLVPVPKRAFRGHMDEQTFRDLCAAHLGKRPAIPSSMGA
jgi:YcxB-like protein